MASEEIHEKVALKLFECNAVKFGSFTLKSGITSPVYFDLRVIVSYPKLMREVSELLYQAAQQNNCEYKSVCGVPYTALPLATIIGGDHDVPMLIRRKEAKGYGTKKLIEGHFTRGDPCLIVEDVVTSGSSVMETVEALATEGLVVRDTVVLLDREQGGRDMLKSKGINLHSVFGMGQLLDILHKHNAVSDDVIKDVRTFIRENRTFKPEGDNTGDITKTSKKVLSYEERASHCTHPVAKRLLSIMSEKCTNLAFSADVTSSEQLLKFADSVGPHICLLKTHIDILEDFSEDVVQKLSSVADKHNFLLFEDRKFADIGNTVKQQYGGGLYRISDWAHITNAHALPGTGIIQGLKEIGGPKDRGCLLLAEMSSKGNLATGDYTKATVSMAQEHSDFVMGFISVQKVTDDPKFIHMTPGVQLQAGGDALGQQYATPHDVITTCGSDVIIVGRGILQAPDPAEAARQYKESGYTAYRAALDQC